MARVRPYYIYMADQVAGGEHFRTTVADRARDHAGARGGPAAWPIPHFVIDAPGGGGKVPLLPEYVESLTDDEVVLRNFKGERYVYRQPGHAVRPKVTPIPNTCWSPPFDKPPFYEEPR